MIIDFDGSEDIIHIRALNLDYRNERRDIDFEIVLAEDDFLPCEPPPGVSDSPTPIGLPAEGSDVSLGNEIVDSVVETEAESQLQAVFDLPLRLRVASVIPERDESVRMAQRNLVPLLTKVFVRSATRPVTPSLFASFPLPQYTTLPLSLDLSSTPLSALNPQVSSPMPLHIPIRT
jgi:hypothetical protein